MTTTSTNKRGDGSLNKRPAPVEPRLDRSTKIFNISLIPAVALSIPLILLSCVFLTPLFLPCALRSVFKEYGAGANWPNRRTYP
jgi:hypothetical protein